MRPFWPMSGAIGVSTTIGAPQATQGLVRRASFICFLLPLLSDVLIDRCGLRRPAAPLLQPGRERLACSWRTRQAEGCQRHGLRSLLH